MDHRHQPSVFELLGSDSLKNGLREAFRYLLKNIYQIDTVKRLPIPHVDESVFLLDLIIEYNYLRTYNASYAEKLFGLIRVQRSSDGRLESRLSSIIALCIFPYFKHKLDKYFEELNYKDDRTVNDVKRIRLYKLFCRSCSFINLLCLLRLAAGNSKYHNIIDGLINIKLVGRCNEDDEHSSTLLFDVCSKTIADLLGKTLTMGSYAIQFLDYWNTRNNSAPLFSASLPIPEPPPKTRGKEDTQPIPYSDDKSSSLCLICLHVRQNECTLSNTGYVYCYACIHRYVKTKQRCPVTNHPAKLDNIVKLYSDSNNYYPNI